MQTPTAYYNEIEPFCCSWLSNLMDAGLITPGKIDDRSIHDVSPGDVTGFQRVHFFAGLGGWDHALNLAGWGEWPVWSGSCPCQPFSAAGKRKGAADERHLWPEFRRLIEACRPGIVFGEQVASAEGRKWLCGSANEAGGEPAEANRRFEHAGIRGELEDLGYAFGAADLCGPCAGEEGEGWILHLGGVVVRERISIGAPHIRQRLFWGARAVGDAESFERGLSEGSERERDFESFGAGPVGRMADDSLNGRREGHSIIGRCDSGVRAEGNGSGPADSGELSRLDLAPSERNRAPENAGGDCQGETEGRECGIRGSSAVGELGHAESPRHAGSEHAGAFSEKESGRARLLGIGGSIAPSWSDFSIIPCADGKSRRVESGSFPLAARIPSRRSDERMGLVFAELAKLGHDTKDAGRILREARGNRTGRLRGFGNSIVPQVAAEFIMAFMEASDV